MDPSQHRSEVALAHDYLTQRGGAERVALSLAKSFPGATLHTSLYQRDSCFPDFAGIDVEASPLNRVGVFRRDHRLALPLLAPTFSAMRTDAAVTVCSSSGWAHGIRTTGRKIVYCHNPARWLYQRDVYLSGLTRGSDIALACLAPALRRWDRAAASSCSRYLVNSTVVRRRVAETYGIDAEVLPPPISLDPKGEADPVEGLEPGFVLCVSRLLPYKNVDAVIAAAATLPDERLVVAGSGPLAPVLAHRAPPNVTFLGEVGDPTLRWLYGASAAVVAASYEDFGLTPLEGASFGRPAAVLRWGGFLDTTVEGETGVFFDRPDPVLIAAALKELRSLRWSSTSLRAHASGYSETHFAERIRAVVADEGADIAVSPSLSTAAPATDRPDPDRPPR